VASHESVRSGIQCISREFRLSPLPPPPLLSPRGLIDFFHQCGESVSVCLTCPPFRTRRCFCSKPDNGIKEFHLILNSPNSNKVVTPRIFPNLFSPFYDILTNNQFSGSGQLLPQNQLGVRPPQLLFLFYWPQIGFPFDLLLDALLFSPSTVVLLLLLSESEPWCFVFLFFCVPFFLSSSAQEFRLARPLESVRYPSWRLVEKFFLVWAVLLLFLSSDLLTISEIDVLPAHSPSLFPGTPPMPSASNQLIPQFTLLFFRPSCPGPPAFLPDSTTV